MRIELGKFLQHWGWAVAYIAPLVIVAAICVWVGYGMGRDSSEALADRAARSAYAEINPVCPVMICQCRYDVEMPRRLKGMQRAMEYVGTELSLLKRCK